MDIRETIVDAIGDTPLVRLGRLHPPGNLVAKIEAMNPGGSVKDRIGLGMIERAEQNGWLEPGGTIVEPTSGNTGVGLAMAAALKGYKLVAVMADKQSKEKQDLLRAYGAEVIVCGHSHRPFARQVDGVWFINTGSVGRPDDGDPRAAYAVLQIGPEFEPEFLQVRHHRLEYDVDRAVEALRKHNFPEAFGQMLRQGRNLDEVLPRSDFHRLR